MSYTSMSKPVSGCPQTEKRHTMGHHPMNLTTKKYQRAISPASDLSKRIMTVPDTATAHLTRLDVAPGHSDTILGSLWSLSC